MVENITEFIKNFRERLSSPFFFSFVVAWIFFNWEVSVALIWYNSDLYPKSGDLIKFVDDNTDNYQSLLYPFLSASLYTGVLRNLVSAFVAWTLRWGGNWNLEISKESNVPMSKFLAYRDLYNKANENLEKIIKDESKTIEHLDKQIQKTRETETEKNYLQGELLKSTGEINNLNFKLSTSELEMTRLKSVVDSLEQESRMNRELLGGYSNVIFMDGNWKFRYDNSLRGLFLEESFSIRDGIISVVHGSEQLSTYSIKFFFHDIINKKIVMHLMYIPESTEAKVLDRYSQNVMVVPTGTMKEAQTYFRVNYPRFLIHELDVQNNGNTLYGTENAEALIHYGRIK